MKKLVMGFLAGVFVSVGGSTVLANDFTTVPSSGRISGVEAVFAQDSISVNEILQIVNRQWIDNIVSPIIHYIDVTNINPNDWIDRGLLSALGSNQGLEIVNDVISRIERVTGPLEGRVSFTATIDNNETADIRVVLDDKHYVSLKANIQDIISSGIFSLRELITIANLVEVEVSSESSNKFNLVHVDVSDVQDLINSGVISNEKLLELAGLVELKVSYR